MVGSGAAGVGIVRLLRSAMQRAGTSQADANGAIAMLDSRGLLVEGREVADDYKREFAWSRETAASYGLSPEKPAGLRESVAAVKPTILIGTSGQPGLFDEGTVRLMASNVYRPVIFPFSNPTSRSEATPAELIESKLGTDDVFFRDDLQQNFVL